MMSAYSLYENECEQIVEICRRLYQRNLLAAADGNLSMKVGEHILMTPSGVSKGFVKPEQIALISADYEVLDGNPSTERLMHFEVYKSAPEARAVVHAHPPHAIAWTVAAPHLKELPSRCLSEVILAVGKVPIADYARPGSQAMGDVLCQYLPENKAMILSRHGALVWGESLEEAWMGMERIEHSAEILYKAKTLGELTELDANEISVLQQMRERIGNRCL